MTHPNRYYGLFASLFLFVQPFAVQAVGTDQIVYSSTSLMSVVGEDMTAFGHSMSSSNLWKPALLGVGITLASSAFDKSFDKMAQRSGDSSVARNLESAGNALPFVMLGYSGLAALTSRDAEMVDVGLAAFEAGSVGVAAALALKYATGRHRPEDNRGSAAFDPLSSGNGDSSLPSVHTTLAWAMITPYAKAYDAPWLYGVAALTNVARVGERKHWFSDTVGGALLGYGLGSLFWENRKSGQHGPSVYVTPGEVGVTWKLR